MAVERMPVVVLMPPVVTVGAGRGGLRVPSEAGAAAERAVYDRGLLTGRLLRAHEDRVRLEAALDAALWRAADAAVDAAEVARARDVLRQHAATEVALRRAAHPEPPLWRDWLGLALLPLVVVWGWVREAVIAVVGGLALAFGLVALLTVVMGWFV